MNNTQETYWIGARDDGRYQLYVNRGGRDWQVSAYGRNCISDNLGYVRAVARMRAGHNFEPEVRLV